MSEPFDSREGVMDETILCPNPFCKDVLTMERCMIIDRYKYYLNCISCGYSAPDEKSEEEAKKIHFITVGKCD